MTTKGRKPSRILAGLAFAGVIVLGGTQAASALGWSPVVNCSGGGILSGRSYQISFSNAGGTLTSTTTVAEASGMPGSSSDTRCTRVAPGPSHLRGCSKGP